MDEADIVVVFVVVFEFIAVMVVGILHTVRV
jgi:hypothetical protein